MTPEQIINVLDKAKQVPSFQDIVVRDDLSQRELARLAVRSALLSGVSFGRSLRRIYPQGIARCHVTGYVSPVTKVRLRLIKHCVPYQILAPVKLASNLPMKIIAYEVFPGVNGLR